MKFKIDTKEKIVVFSLQEAVLDANLSAQLPDMIKSLPELEARNLILDLTLVENIATPGIEAILTVYQFMYDNNYSCVITGVNNKLTLPLRELGGDMLNLAPTMAEAIDLVMMEELERELLNGLE
ncbi:STAS domain-containing protein [Chitinophaga nivalis]|uniref:STAS domain-containing protein n=1 Tax=Chitinophaga nivalis TaxID=2991709 RepID=A0ABT3IS08_9BACT|nr:STAS domain-containing protein [Chitinophaga nivalis]MCW3463545.1 STAS domain-containing protein [Chitinophaga nivalis]MCW3486765.1 STAS domain-containing protein [Chitinophaga nivalis]